MSFRFRLWSVALPTLCFAVSAMAQDCDLPLAVQRVPSELDVSTSPARNEFVDGSAAAGAVAIVESASGDGDLLFRGRFVTGSWRGHLEAFALPHLAGATPRWDAGELLRRREADDRRIFTVVDDKQIGLDRDHARELMAQLGVDTVAEAIRVIRAARGEEFESTRDRDGWKLGDIAHATPVVVGPPRRFLLDPDYQGYLQEHAEREPVIYVGANDGMLHAFRARDGRELWAFAPGATLVGLRDLVDGSACHRSFVDLSPSVFDVRLSSGWRTVLIGGERNGGDSYFALDVSDPHNPRVLWERSIPSLDRSFVQPALVRTPGANALWIGSPPNASGEAWLYRIDVESGKPLEPAQQVDLSSRENMLGAATAIDLDFDGYHDLVYQATLSGRVLRWSRDADGDAWNAVTLFDSGGQPIQSRPSVAYLGADQLLVSFGTGRYLRGEDVYENAPQDFYGVIDDLRSGSLSLGPSDLRDQSYGVYDTKGFSGWHFRLQNDDNERVVEAAAIVEGVVYFSSFAPHVGRAVAGGNSWLYAVDLRSGAPIDNVRSVALGEGIASRPVIALGHGSILVQGSDARLHRRPLSVLPTTLKVRSWRETTDEGTRSTLPAGR